MLLNPSSNENREKLKDLILRNGLKWSEGVNPDGSIPRWIFDLREVILTPQGATLAAKLIYDKIRDNEFDAIGGPSVAAEPLVSSILMQAYFQNRAISGFIVRKEPNDFGLRKKIEGPIKPGQRVILIDDILNSGKGMSDAIESVGMMGCKIVKIVTLLDFLKSGHSRLLEQGYDLDYIYSLDNLNLELNETYKYEEFKMEIVNGEPRVPDEIKNLFGGEIIDMQSHGNMLIAAIENGSLWCLENGSWNVKWHLDLGESILAPLLLDGETAIVAVSSGLRRSLLFLINVYNGEVIKYMRIKGSIYSPPTQHDLSYLVGTDDKKLYMIGKKDLGVIWTSHTNGAIRMKPILDEDAIYFCSDDGFTYVLFFNGKLKWKKHYGKINVPPVIFDDKIILKSENDIIFCLNKHDGKLNWFYELKNKVMDLAVVGNLVVAGGLHGYVVALELNSGKRTKAIKLSNEIIQKIKTVDGGLHIRCEGGKNYDVKIS